MVHHNRRCQKRSWRSVSLNSPGIVLSNPMILKNVPEHSLSLNSGSIWMPVEGTKITSAASRKIGRYSCPESYIYVIFQKVWWKWVLVTRLRTEVLPVIVIRSSVFQGIMMWQVARPKYNMETSRTNHKTANSSDRLELRLNHFAGLRWISFKKRIFGQISKNE